MYLAKYYSITRAITWCIIGIIAMLLVCALTGCTTTKYVEVEKIHHDSIYITKLQKDSVYLHDSVWVEKFGDTVRIDRWHTKYIEKQIHDTTYVAKRDTIPQPYPQEVYIEKKLNWLQRTLMYAGGLSICAIIIFLVIKFKKFLPF